jgi:hypothetical protein
MVTKLDEARFQELEPGELTLLWRFTQAHRDHDTPPTWQELKANGLTKIDEDSLLDLIIDQYEYEQADKELVTG